MQSIVKKDIFESLSSTGAKFSSDEETLEFFAHDLYSRGTNLVAVVQPANNLQLAAAVKIATSCGHAVIPRGGGMSYTGGFTANHPGAVLFDLSLMNRVLEVDRDNMTVTVEAGCTWSALHKHLSPMGLRTPMWGTLSGLKATIGGSLSQNSIFWGTGRHGTAAQSCKALEVVLADGTILKVGKNQVRPYGPDLVGLFLADCGALGIKASVTLRLVHETQANAYASFAFDDRAAWLRAAAEIERQGIATECFGFDPYLNAIRMRRESLASDAKSLVSMMRRQGSLGKAIVEGAKVVRAGRSFLEQASFSLHVLAEGRIQASADADVRAAIEIATALGGREVENTIPKILRANPFGPLNAMLGPDGERWAPIHGHVPHSRAEDCYSAIERLFADHAEEMEELGVHHGTLLAVINGGCTVIEPCLYWPDRRNPLIDATVEPAHLKRLPDHESNPAARNLAARLKRELVDLFFSFDAAHFQIGRTYRYRESLQPAADGILLAIKREVDPHGLMNPGAIGLGPE